MRVLYATDGSASSRGVVGLLGAIARRDRTEVTVLSVAPPGEDRAQATAAELAAAGFRTSTRSATGRAADEILRLIAEEGFELTALGAGHRTVGNLLLGTVSSHVLHRSPSSVLIIREEPPGGARAGVLLGVDGSAEASRAVDVLIDLADPARCDVTVLAVAEILAPTLFPPGSGYALSLPTEEARPEMTADATRHADDAAGRLRKAGFSVETNIVLGHAPRRLVAEATRLSSDLVAVGSRGLGALKRAILGSVSEEVTKSARAALVARVGPA